MAETRRKPAPSAVPDSSAQRKAGSSPTLRDLARTVGVSRTTISLALRHHPRIPEETRLRVSAAAEKIGYRPDPKVSRLMTYLRLRRRAPASEIIAVINNFPQRAPWTTNTHLRAVHDSILARAPSLGFAVEDFWLAERGMTPARLSGILRARGIEGMVLLSFPHFTPTLEINWADFACAAIGHSLALPLHRVSSHQYRDLTTALKELAAAGYTRPGLALNPDVDQRVEHYYVAAYLLAQSRRPPVARMTPLLFTGGRDQFVRWFERERPDVILLSQPPPAREDVETWLRAMGRRCPRDVGLVLLDLPHAGSTASGIRQPYGEIAAAAVDLVAAQISRGERGLPALPQIINLEGAWRPGDTTRRRAD